VDSSRLSAWLSRRLCLSGQEGPTPTRSTCTRSTCTRPTRSRRRSSRSRPQQQPMTKRSRSTPSAEGTDPTSRWSSTSRPRSRPTPGCACTVSFRPCTSARRHLGRPHLARWHAWGRDKRQAGAPQDAQVQEGAARQARPEVEARHDGWDAGIAQLELGMCNGELDSQLHLARETGRRREQRSTRASTTRSDRRRVSVRPLALQIGCGRTWACITLYLAFLTGKGERQPPRARASRVERGSRRSYARSSTGSSLRQLARQR